MSMQYNVGRPQKSLKEEQFKETITRHKDRIMLEARCLIAITDAFVRDKNQEQFTSERCRSLFSSNGQEQFYSFLQQQYEVRSPTLSQQQQKEYSSNRDSLFLLAQLHTNYLKERVISVAELLFFLLFFLQRNGLLNEASCKWLLENSCKFMVVMLEGPNNNIPRDSSYELIELLVRWMLLLASMEELSISCE